MRCYETYVILVSVSWMSVLRRQLSNTFEQFIKVSLLSESSERKLYLNLVCKKHSENSQPKQNISLPSRPSLKNQIPHPLSVVSPSWFTFDKRGHCDNILKSGHICTFLPLRQKGSQGLTPEPITLQYSNYFNTKWGGGQMGGVEKI